MVSAWKTRLGEWWPTLAKQVYLANSGSCYKRHDGSTEISFFFCAWDFGNRAGSGRDGLVYLTLNVFIVPISKPPFQLSTCFWAFQRSWEWEGWGELLKSSHLLSEVLLCSWCPCTAAPRKGGGPRQTLRVTRTALQLSLSIPPSACTVHNLQSNRLDNACTNIGTSLASLAFVHHSCMWGRTRRPWGHVCNLFVGGLFLPLPVVGARQPNELRLA